jgi:hypothetical protein
MLVELESECPNILPNGEPISDPTASLDTLERNHSDFEDDEPELVDCIAVPALMEVGDDEQAYPDEVDDDEQAYF